MGTTFFSLLGSTTLGGTSATITLSGLPAKKFLMIELYALQTLTLITGLRFNNDSGSNYSSRKGSNGAADTTAVSATSIALDATTATPCFYRIFVMNIKANEKVVIVHRIDQNTAGAANVPNRDEVSGKWVNTTSQITEVDIISSTSTFAANSSLSVWGSDYLNVTDSITFTETIKKLIGKSVTDLDPITDTVSKLISAKVTDLDQITDTTSKRINKSVSDILSSTDTVTTLRSRSITISDAVSMFESVTKQPIKKIIETPSFAESVSKLIGILALESVVLSDSVSKGITKLLTDGDVFDDETTKFITISISENPGLSDSISKAVFKAINDNVVITEQGKSRQVIKISDDLVSSDAVNKAVVKAIIEIVGITTITKMHKTHSNSKTRTVLTFG